MKNKKVITALLLAALMSVSACGKKEKTDRFKKYLTNGEYQEAADYMKEHDVDRDDYTDEIKEQADIVMEAYKKGEATSSETISKLKILGNLAGEEGRTYIKELKKQIDDIEESNSNFENGEYYFSSGYYSDAKEYYEKVAEGTPHYEEAQKKLAECDDKYEEQLFKDVDDYIASGWYDSALDKLESAKDKVKDKQKIEDKIKEIKASQKDALIKDIEDDYATWDDAGYALDSINDLLEDYPNDKDVKDLYDKYAEIYADDRIEKAKEWAEEYKDYEYAEEILNNALEKIPDNEKILAYLEELGGAKPATFAELDFTGSGFKKADKDMNDTDGHDFPKENTIYSSDGTDKEYTAEFNLDGKYTLFSAVAAPALGFNKDASAKLEVICDDKVDETITFKADDYYKSLDIDVTGVKKIVFKVTPAEGDKLDKQSIIISKASVKKADAAEEKTEEATKAEEKDAEAATTTAKAE